MEAFSFSNIVAILSLGVAIFSVGYSVRTNTKIYELTVNYRNEILAWYGQVIDKMILLRHMVITDNFNDEEKNKNLAALSSLIEKGRFFYPNVDTGDDYGKEKQLAYRGYRSIPLEFLVYFYDIAKKDDAAKYLSHMYFLERHFTSFIFESLDPKEHNKKSTELVNIKYDNSKMIDDFLQEEPAMHNIFRILY